VRFSFHSPVRFFIGLLQLRVNIIQLFQDL
jgi:hypothetical protein